MKKHLKLLIHCLIAVLALLCFTPRQASAQEGLGASKACAGHTLGEVNGCPACMVGENLHICENNFPDANFRGYLMDELFGSDSVPIEQVNNERWINCYYKEIASLKGIEFFAALEYLDCDSNQLTSLDVSKNAALEELSCCYNQLTNLDVSGCPALKHLECLSNQLTNLDVRKNIELIILDCGHNQLSSLDLSQNKELTRLECTYNQLTSLDVSKNAFLEYLDCYSNQLINLDVRTNTVLIEFECSCNDLTSLDVSQNKVLTRLECHSNQLLSLDVSKNMALKILVCGYNQLTSLDVSQNEALKNLECFGNPLTSLNVSRNEALEHLHCSSNQLTNLDVSKNTALKTLYCGVNQLTRLDVSRNNALTVLSCELNNLTSLDVSGNMALEHLRFDSNQLTNLDVSNNTALTWLQCGYNQLTNIDLSKNTALDTLYCSGNQLTSLDVSKNPALDSLECYYNQLTSLDLSKNTSLYGYRISPQWVIIQSPSLLTQVDLAPIVGNENLSNVVTVDPGTFDPTTGLVTLEEGTTKFKYYYATENATAGNMEVNVEVQLPPITITYDPAGGQFINDKGEALGDAYLTETLAPGETGSLYFGYNEGVTIAGSKEYPLQEASAWQKVGGERYYLQKPGFVLCGWENAETGEVLESWERLPKYIFMVGDTHEDFVIKPEQSATWRAVWTPAFTMTLYSEGQKISSQEMGNGWKMRVAETEDDYVHSYITPPAPREGYGFNGWKEKVNGTEYALGDTISFQSDLELEAMWGKKITLTYDMGDEPYYDRNVALQQGLQIVEANSGQRIKIARFNEYGGFWPQSQDSSSFATYYRIKGDESGKLYQLDEEYIPYEDTVFEAVWMKKCVIQYNFKYENDFPYDDYDNIEGYAIVGYQQSERLQYEDAGALNSPYKVRESFQALWEVETPTYLAIIYKDDEGNGGPVFVYPIGWREIDPQHNQIFVIDQKIYPQGDMSLYAAWNLGWNRTLGRNWYYMEDNTFPVSCFKEIDGETYYFDELGFAVTGIYEVEGKQYLFDEDGVLIGEIIPPSEDALKEAAGVSGDSTDVIMDVEKQEGEANPADVEKIRKEVGEDFEVVSAFDIKLFSVEYDAEGKEVGREPITQLNKPVLLTFVTPGEAGKTYQVVRIHVNEKGEVEVALLPTTDNGDGTVSAESDKFSMYYLAEMDKSDRLPGDVNNDGQVTLMDLVRLCKYLAGYQVVINEANSDVNGDGQVTLMDLVRLCKHLAGYDVVLE